jgi:hypothetical protein
MGVQVAAGVTRPSACLDALYVNAGISALAAAASWLETTDGKQGFHRFMTDRPNRRPWECFP